MEGKKEKIKRLIDKLDSIKSVTEKVSKELNEYLARNEDSEPTTNGVKSEEITKLFDELSGEVSTVKKEYVEFVSISSKTKEKSSDIERHQPIPLTKEVKKEHEENRGNGTTGKKYIKLVDFNKLVDPQKLEIMNKKSDNNNRKPVGTQDSSVIVLSSSEDEEPLRINTNSTLQKYSRDQLRMVNISSKEGGLKCVILKQALLNKRRQMVDNDFKFMCKPYVKLLRVKCEDMKRYYEEKNKRDAIEAKMILDEVTGQIIEKCDNQPRTPKQIQKRKSPRPKSKQKAYKTANESNSDDESNSESQPNEKSVNNDENSNEKMPTPTSEDKETTEENVGPSTEPDSTCENGANSSNDDASSNSDLEKSTENVNEKNNSKDSDDEKDPSDSDDSVGFINKRKTKKKVGFKGICSDSEDEPQMDKTKTDSESDDENDKEKESDKSKKLSESDEDDFDKNGSKRETKRRRIRNRNDSSDEDDSQKTRKKLKLSGKLSDSTKQAALDERERRNRVLEKQNKYNQIYENMNLESSKLEKLVLDYDEVTEEPILEVDKKLVAALKPHQATGIQFMWDACFESVKKISENDGSGCILAHCMGLGKTLQVIALVDTLLNSYEKSKVRKVLVVTPLSTVLNWKAEFKNWLSDEEDYHIFELVSCKSTHAERSLYMRRWHEDGGVMVMSYAMFRNFSNDANRKIGKKYRDIYQKALVDPGPELVICDEGHLLKNEKTGISIAMNKIRTKRRIVLTGTPLQNNLREYFCMVQFVKPNLLGSYKEYLSRFVNPITNGQYTDSTQYDIDLMRRRSHVLHKLLEGIVQRKDYEVLAPYLPPKHEYVLFLSLTEVQKKLYRYYLENLARMSKDKPSSLFQDYNAFARICIHPRVLLDKSIDDLEKFKDDDEESVGSLKDFINDDGDSETPSDDLNSDSDESENNKKFNTRSQRAARRLVGYESEEEEDTRRKEWWQEFCDGDELDNMAHSTKILLLFEILKECEEMGDKVLVFSQSLYALNVIEYFLARVNQATQDGDAEEKTCGYTGCWVHGLDYFRLDGSTNCNLRSNWCNNFNRESSRARLFLLSTRAGGLGINLVAANRVIIFDVSWNPSSDVQSIYRVYRFGQLKPSYVYRFVMYGTMEMKIYERQVTKQAISKRVIDEQQIDRHYNQNDLAELYKMDVPTSESRPIPMVPKDVLLGEMLQKHEDKIYKYHEHQSLLENRTHETLNEAEMKAAWDEFENEKVERNKQHTIGNFQMSTIHVALRSILKKDNPTYNNNQILSVIPQVIKQLEIEFNQGNLYMYNKIAEEVQKIQAEYAERMQMQLNYQNLQKMKDNVFANQKMFEALNSAQVQRFKNHNLPGTSASRGSNEVIDLN